MGFLQSGKTLGSFTLNNRFPWRGRSGEIWSATGPDGTEVIIKLPAMEDSAPDRDLQRKEIEKEIRFLKEMQTFSPPVIKCLDTGKFTPLADSYPYLVLEKAPSETLADILERTHPDQVPLLEFLEIFDLLLEVLVEAHKKGIIYNDVDCKHIFWSRQNDNPNFFTAQGNRHRIRVIDWANSFKVSEKLPEGVSKASDIAQASKVLRDIFTLQGLLAEAQFEREYPEISKISKDARNNEFRSVSVFRERLQHLSGRERLKLNALIKEKEDVFSRIVESPFDLLTMQNQLDVFFQNFQKEVRQHHHCYLEAIKAQDEFHARAINHALSQALASTAPESLDTAWYKEQVQPLIDKNQAQISNRDEALKQRYSFCGYFRLAYGFMVQAQGLLQVNEKANRDQAVGSRKSTITVSANQSVGQHSSDRVSLEQYPLTASLQDEVQAITKAIRKSCKDLICWMSGVEVVLTPTNIIEGLLDIPNDASLDQWRYQVHAAKQLNIYAQNINQGIPDDQLPVDIALVTRLHHNFTPDIKDRDLVHAIQAHFNRLRPDTYHEFSPRSLAADYEELANDIVAELPELVKIINQLNALERLVIIIEDAASINDRRNQAILQKHVDKVKALREEQVKLHNFDIPTQFSASRRAASEELNDWINEYQIFLNYWGKIHPTEAKAKREQLNLFEAAVNNLWRYMEGHDIVLQSFDTIYQQSVQALMPLTPTGLQWFQNNVKPAGNDWVQALSFARPEVGNVVKNIFDTAYKQLSERSRFNQPDAPTEYRTFFKTLSPPQKEFTELDAIIEQATSGAKTIREVEQLLQKMKALTETTSAFDEQSKLYLSVFDHYQDLTELETLYEICNFTEAEQKRKRFKNKSNKRLIQEILSAKKRWKTGNFNEKTNFSTGCLDQVRYPNSPLADFLSDIQEAEHLVIKELKSQELISKLVAPSTTGTKLTAKATREEEQIKRQIRSKSTKAVSPVASRPEQEAADLLQRLVELTRKLGLHDTAPEKWCQHFKQIILNPEKSTDWKTLLKSARASNDPLLRVYEDLQPPSAKQPKPSRFKMWLRVVSGIGIVVILIVAIMRFYQISNNNAANIQATVIVLQGIEAQQATLAIQQATEAATAQQVTEAAATQQAAETTTQQAAVATAIAIQQTESAATATPTPTSMPTVTPTATPLDPDNLSMNVTAPQLFLAPDAQSSLAGQQLPAGDYAIAGQFVDDTGTRYYAVELPDNLLENLPADRYWVLAEEVLVVPGTESVAQPLEPPTPTPIPPPTLNLEDSIDITDSLADWISQDYYQGAWPARLTGPVSSNAYSHYFAREAVLGPEGAGRSLLVAQGRWEIAVRENPPSEVLSHAIIPIPLHIPTHRQNLIEAGWTDGNPFSYFRVRGTLWQEQMTVAPEIDAIYGINAVLLPLDDHNGNVVTLWLLAVSSLENENPTGRIELWLTDSALIAWPTEWHSIIAAPSGDDTVPDSRYLAANINPREIIGSDQPIGRQLSVIEPEIDISTIDLAFVRMEDGTIGAAINEEYRDLSESLANHPRYRWEDIEQFAIVADHRTSAFFEQISIK